MWEALLAAFTAMCGAIGVAYTYTAAFLSLAWSDLGAVWAWINGTILYSGTHIQTFGAHALKAWGGLN